MSLQLGLFDLPPRARTAYPLAPGAKREGTSQSAADAIAPRAPLLREKVLAELRRGPGTADGIAARLKIDKLSVRPRCTELSLAGKIIDTGRRAPNDSGKKAIVWGLIA